jgi:hypothetical protein
MIYKGPDFLAVVGIGSSPIPSPLSRQNARLATHRKTLKIETTNLLAGEGGGRGGGGEKSYDGEKAWFS